MDWERIEANWTHYKDLAKARWNRITADEFDLINGHRDTLAGQIQEVYGISKDAAQMQLESWRGTLEESDAKP